jgi:hypothetical protein
MRPDDDDLDDEMGAAIGASLMPALRAPHVDVLQALRAE